MAAPSLTYTLTNGSTADATQVMQNFNDLLNGITDSTKDLSINALNCAGTVTINGNATFGNSSVDVITANGTFASTLTPTDASYDLGGSSNRWRRLYLSSGWVGTTTNDSASSGFVGEELIQSRTVASATVVTTATSLNITAAALSLTAGDWIVSGCIFYQFGAGATVGELVASVSTTSATVPASTSYGAPSSNQLLVVRNHAGSSFGSGCNQSVEIPSYRISVASTTSFYLVGYATFGVASCSASGYISARRVR